MADPYQINEADSPSANLTPLSVELGGSSRDKLLEARDSFLNYEQPNKNFNSIVPNAHAVPADADNYSALSDSHHVEANSSTSGDYFKAFIFGGLDGVVTIFAIVAGSMGAKFSPLSIVIIGLGNLFADAISMGLGEYVSASAEASFINAEREREQWEVENCPEEEKKEMYDIYTKKYDFLEADAHNLVELTFKYPKFFVEHMMVEELGLMVDDGTGPTPLKRAFVMFGSFCIFGVVPLIGFIIWDLIAGNSPHASGLIGFIVAIVCSAITLFILGIFKGLFVNQNMYKSALLMVLNGGIAGAVAYGIGALLLNAVGSATT